MTSLTIFLLWLGLSITTATVEDCVYPPNATYPFNVNSYNTDQDPCCCTHCNSWQSADPNNIKCYFQNANKYGRTETISKGNNPVNVLVDSLRSEEVKKNIESKVYNESGNSYTILNGLEHTNTDAFLAMHKGEVVYERYWDQAPYTRHTIWSCTKSYFALLAELLIDEDNDLHEEDPVSKHVSELDRVDAFKGATVRNVMDMTVAIDYDESKYGPGSDFTKYSIDVVDKGMREAIMKMKPHKNRTHGEVYEYATPVTDVLGWILDNYLGGNGEAAIEFQNRIWTKLGQEHDILMSTYPYLQSPYANLYVPRNTDYGGGASATARDMARFGQMMMNKGKSADGIQVVPEKVINDIFKGGTPANVQQFDKSQECKKMGGPPCGRAYRSMFRVQVKNTTSGLPSGIVWQQGIHGQYVWMDPRNNYVAVKQSSQQKSIDLTIMRNEFDILMTVADGLQGSDPKSKKSKRRKASKSAKDAY